MYYVITQEGVSKGSLSSINKKLNTKLETQDFKFLGSDKIVTLSADNLEFLQDKKQLSKIPIQNLFKVDNTVKYITIFMVFLQFILMLKK